MRLPAKPSRPVLTLLVSTVALCGVVAAIEWRTRSAQPAPHAERWVDALPGDKTDGGYVSSDTCQACHPKQYASWHASYHRTMTQVATPDTVVAPFDDRTMTARDREYRLFRRGDAYWVEMEDPDRRRQLGAPRVERRVVMTTGSHHQQRFWVEGTRGRRLDLLPFVWLIAEARWVPGEAIFLTLPHKRHGLAKGSWNKNCVSCHSTAGTALPRLNAVRPDTQAAELGIACEACHGPAEEHVRVNRDPVRRYRMHLTDDPDPTIVNPSRLSTNRASEVCGQCHAVFEFEPDSPWRQRGELAYRPGEELEENRRIVRYATEAREPWQQRWLHGSPSRMEANFWPDGTGRVSGREYNGLLESGCFQRGELSCLSCHSMHESDPDKQLAAGMDGDEACLSCHAPIRADLEAHTRHDPDSVGSRCYNCHMPYTTHGLLRALRSHRVDSPSAAVSAETGRPNACNLCHLDQSLGWTARHLSDWYGAPPVALNEEQETVSAALLWLLKGDAIQRAVTAWNMGWEPALQTSGRDWQAPFLAQLLNDPYSAVRFNAHRSLTQLPGYEAVPFDYLAPPDELLEARRRVFQTWTSKSVDRDDPALLLDGDGKLEYAALEALLSQRDDRLVRIAE